MRFFTPAAILAACSTLAAAVPTASIGNSGCDRPTRRKIPTNLHSHRCSIWRRHYMRSTQYVLPRTATATRQNAAHNDTVPSPNHTRTLHLTTISPPSTMHRHHNPWPRPQRAQRRRQQNPLPRRHHSPHRALSRLRQLLHQQTRHIPRLDHSPFDQEPVPARPRPQDHQRHRTRREMGRPPRRLHTHE
jgi:hypothetical protein